MFFKVRRIILYNKKQSLIAIIGLVITISFSYLSVYANTTKNGDKIRVGYSFNYGILDTNSESEGIGYGYGYDYLKEIAKYTGWEYEYVLVTWEEGMERLKSGDIDLFGPLQYSDERAENFNYARYDAGTEYGTLYTKADNNLIYYEDFDSFDGIRVATMFSNYQNEDFDKYCKENNFSVEYVYYEDTVDIVDAVINGYADACICGSLIYSEELKAIGTYSAEPFYFASTKGNEEISKEMDMASKKIRFESPEFTDELYAKYYYKDIEKKPDFTRKEMEYIKIHNELNVVYDSNSSPMEYYDYETKSFKGINADIINIIENKTGFKFNFIKTNNVDESLEYIKTGKAQIISGYKGNVKNAQNYLIFTKPYINIPMVMVGNANREADDNFKLAVESGLYDFQSNLEKMYSRSVIYTYKTIEEVLYAVRSNEVNGGVINSYLFDELAKNRKVNGLKIISNIPVVLSMNIGVSKYCDDILVSILNKTINNLTEEEKNTIVLTNTINKNGKLPISVVLQEYAFPITIFVGTIILVVLFLIISNNNMNEKRLQYIAFTDKLTGLENWEKLEMEAEKFLPGKDNQYSFVYFDVDNFKLINDVYGYAQGTETLINIAGVIKSEIKDEEFGVRISGDKFVMILKLTDESEIIERLKKMFEDINKVCRSTYNSFYTISFSCGIYVIIDGALSINNISDKANIARRTVKQHHGTSFAMYDDAIRRKLLEEKEVEDIMNESLLNGEFVVFLQPKFNLVENEIAGAEALVRWQLPDRGLMPPSFFIPIFEKNGFIVNVDLFVLECICQNLRRWIDDGIIPVTISVNLSRVHLNNPDLIYTICNILDKYNVPYGCIELELTESAIYGNSEHLLDMMKKFKQLGFMLSMDDFGTGYSSLNLLKDIPIDVLKLDKEFLSECIDTQKGKSIITDVVVMANNIDITVLSEGVETKEQVDFLKNIGCNMVQGFYFDKPMPIIEFEKKFFNY